MKILMTADAVGGVWTYALELARALARRGDETVLAVQGPRPRPAQRAEAEAVPGLRYAEAPYALEWMEDPWRDVDRAGQWLLELAREHRVDLVHLNGYAHASLPFGVPVLVAAHSCLLSWWTAVRPGQPPRAWNEYRRRVAAGLRAADRVVAPTLAMLDALERHHGPWGTPGRPVPNGRDPTRFRAEAKEPFVLAVGRAWDAGKNVALLDAIAPDVPWPIHVAGPTTHPITSETPRLRNLRLLGRVEDEPLRDLYARAAIFVSPARYEPFGYAPLEAAFSGCALVLSDLPSLREVWGGAALYAPPDDPRGFTRHLRRLAQDPIARDRLARAAAYRARRYTPGEMAEGYRDVYARARSLRPEVHASA
jgi:glycogen synthase